MDATMQDVPLTVTQLFEHGRRVHGSSEVLTYEGNGFRRRTFADVGRRVELLAAALGRLGVVPGDRVATLMWNSDEHLEAYFAVPAMGAVLHTLNLRLFPDQLVHIVNEAADRVALVHASVASLVSPHIARLATLEHVIVVDDLHPAWPDRNGAAAAPGGPARAGVDPATAEALGAGGARVWSYEELLAAEAAAATACGVAVAPWPELEERSAAAVCYTSGTTGEPRGVAYSHRSTFLHSFAVNNSGFALDQRDRALMVVPMFHVMAWGLPYAAWLNGADLVMPSRFLQGAPLLAMIEQVRVTTAAGVPTVWAQVAAEIEARPDAEVSSLRLLLSGGAPLPRVLIERFDALGVRIIQGWGMTETSPVCAIGELPKRLDPWDVDGRMRTGRIVPGVDLRLVADDGTVAPWDGTSPGEIEVRGPWITGSYLGGRDPERFHDGWLRTGDIATVDPDGVVAISDRAKDVIKSGGEWISSVDLENEIMGHPQVVEATVVGVPDARWGERPLAVVVTRPGTAVGAEELRGWLAGRVAHWWVPERWSFVADLPKTSVGKFDKKLVRARAAAGELAVVQASVPGPSSPSSWPSSLPSSGAAAGDADDVSPRGEAGLAWGHG